MTNAQLQQIISNEQSARLWVSIAESCLDHLYGLMSANEWETVWGDFQTNSGEWLTVELGRGFFNYRVSNNNSSSVSNNEEIAIKMLAKALAA